MYGSRHNARPDARELGGMPYAEVHELQATAATLRELSVAWIWTSS
jgi:hypothetical protein